MALGLEPSLPGLVCHLVRECLSLSRPTCVPLLFVSVGIIWPLPNPTTGSILPGEGWGLPRAGESPRMGCQGSLLVVGGTCPWIRLSPLWGELSRPGLAWASPTPRCQAAVGGSVWPPGPVTSLWRSARHQ